MTTTVGFGDPLIVTPQDPGTPELLGGKGYGLWQLGRLGLRVPAWIALTTHAAESALAPLRARIAGLLEDVASQDGAALTAAAAELQELVRDACWPPELGQWIDRAFTSLGAERVAVRSSVVGEDGTRDSHAGQMVTCLSVSRPGLERAVRECWASVFSERALRYRQTLGSLAQHPRIAVVIQTMVPGRVSGIAFTADPVSGAPAEIVVAGYGLGQGIVSDLVETDSFTRELGDEAWRSTIRSKTRQVVVRRAGDGTYIAEVPPWERHRPALSHEELRRLSTLVQAIDVRAGRPQDVEWTLDDSGNFWILQARPVTTAPAGHIAIWDDANIGESYPGITLPFTYSYVRSTYEHIFARALRQTGVSTRAVSRARPALSHLVGIVRGRLYFNLINHYRLYAFVPGLERHVSRWESAFGVTRHFDMKSLKRPAGWLRWIRKALVVRTAVWFAWRFLRRGHDVGTLVERVDVMIGRIERGVISNLSLDGLLDLWEEINREFLGMWTILLFNDFYMVRFLDQLAKLAGAGSGGGSGTSELQQRLVSGLDQLRSIDPLRSLLVLASEAERSPQVVDLLRSGRPSRDIWSALQACDAAAAFNHRAALHLALHGQRTVEELKFETVPPADAPWKLLPLICGILDRPRGPAAASSIEGSVDPASELRERCRGSRPRWWYARWVLRNARQCVADRENLSYARCRAYGALRGVALAMGEALAGSGALDQPRDVFYLKMEDIIAFSRGSLPEGELKGLVDLRRRLYSRFSEEAPPRRVAVRGSVYAGYRKTAPPMQSATDPVLRGIPSSPGTVRGCVRVVRDPSMVQHVDGEILVAATTEPGWMFLMHGANGLIVERGSVLSHAAIIGRELGLPTIIGLEGATSLLATGDQVEMNGTTGEIRILERSRQLSENNRASA